MAIKIIYIDDIDGSSDAETVTFSLGGDTYEIDLSASNREQFQHALEPFITKARKQSIAKSISRTKARHSNAEIREWLRSNAHDVPDRGTIRAELVKLWEAR